MWKSLKSTVGVAKEMMFKPALSTPTVASLRREQPAILSRAALPTAPFRSCSDRLETFEKTQRKEENFKENLTKNKKNMKKCRWMSSHPLKKRFPHSEALLVASKTCTAPCTFSAQVSQPYIRAIYSVRVLLISSIRVFPSFPYSKYIVNIYDIYLWITEM